MKKTFKSLGKALLAAEHTVTIICCVAIVLLVFVSVAMRYIFKSSFQGMEELIMLFAFGIYFIGAALSSREETQITADVMSLVVKKSRSQNLLRAFQNLADGVLIGICGVFSLEEMFFVLDAGSRTAGLKLPLWVIYMVIFIGLFLMAFYALVHSVEYFVKFLRYGKEEKEGQE